jgi:hypothetical protein
MPCFPHASRPPQRAAPTVSLAGAPPSCCPLQATGSHRERFQRARAPRWPPWTARTGRWPYGLRVQGRTVLNVDSGPPVA